MTFADRECDNDAMGPRTVDPATWMFGRYRPLSYLGSGGMADVFKCELQGMGGFGKLCVLKRMKPDLVRDPHFVAMFLDEARLIARLSHPNIVQVFEIDEAEGVPFIALEMIRGPTLSQLLRKAHADNNVPVNLVARIAADAALGLHAAHVAKDESGHPLKIVHRDVSPQNIMVDAQGIAKVLDFGVAKAEGKLAQTAVGTLKGKIAYMAPEQLSGGDIDARADVFALGVCLFHSLVGRPPWVGATDVGLLTSRLSDACPSARALRSDVPEALDSILARALSINIARRFASAEELHVALEDFLATQPTPSDAKAVGAWIGKIFPNLDELVVGSPLTAMAHVGAPAPFNALAADEDKTETQVSTTALRPGPAEPGTLTPHTAVVTDIIRMAPAPDLAARPANRPGVRSALGLVGVGLAGAAAILLAFRAAPDGTRDGAPVPDVVAQPTAAGEAGTMNPAQVQAVAAAGQAAAPPPSSGAAQTGQSAATEPPAPSEPAGAAAPSVPSASASSDGPPPSSNRRGRNDPGRSDARPTRRSSQGMAGATAPEIAPSEPATPPPGAPTTQQSVDAAAVDQKPAMLQASAPASATTEVTPVVVTAESRPALEATRPQAPQAPQLASKARVYTVQEVVSACKQIEEQLQARGHFPAAVATNVTAPLARELAARIAKGDAINLPLVDIYWFVARELVAGASKKDVANRLVASYQAGTLGGSRR